MSKILVTGASGNIGNLTVRSLLKRNVPANQVSALVRDPAKAKDLAALGITLHQGDYSDPASLLTAFEGVDKVMLTSSQAFTDRKAAHANVIEAAVRAGVKHIVYMPIVRKPDSKFSITAVSEEDAFTEQKIIASGLAYTFVKHPPFLNTLPPFIGTKAVETGIRVPAGQGRVAPATREDLADAHAAVLTQEGHANKSYDLTGEPALSFADMAQALAKISGRDVPLIHVTDEDYIKL